MARRTEEDTAAPGPGSENGMKRAGPVSRVLGPDEWKGEQLENFDPIPRSPTQSFQAAPPSPSKRSYQQLLEPTASSPSFVRDEFESLGADGDALFSFDEDMDAGGTEGPDGDQVGLRIHVWSMVVC